MNEDENRLPLRPTQPGRAPITKPPTMQSRLARNVKRRSISIASNRDNKQARLENTESGTSSSTGTSASSTSAISLSSTSNRAPNNRPRVTIAGNESANLGVPRGRLIALLFHPQHFAVQVLLQSVRPSLSRRIDTEREQRASLEEKLKEEQEKVAEGKKREEELEKIIQELKQKHEEELAEKNNELREKDDAMRALHNDVVDQRIGQKFTFNHIFPQNFTQEQVFNQVKELILSALHGCNVSVMAYGQTGSGKTHMMRGRKEEAAGLIPRAVEFLFSEAQKIDQLGWKHSFSASFYEVYLDGAFDLLSPSRNKLEMKTTETGTTLPGLFSLPLHSREDMSSLLARFDMNRSTAATKSNDRSSRSHVIFSFKIEGENTTSGSKISSTLNIVDLAGSERQKDTGAEGQQFKEMTAINQALSNLKIVIRALYDKASHVPYRSNILTRLLANTLGGGKSKCLVVVNLNPSRTNLTETKRSLEFASQMSNTKI